MRTGENIFKRQDGRWEARYHKGRDIAGKLIYGYCYGKTYSEAKARAEEAKKQSKFCIKSNKNVLNQPFENYCKEWLTLNQLRIRTSTHAKYKSILENYIVPFFGKLFPNELTSEIINKFGRTLLYEKDLSPKTAKDILLVLNSILKYTKKHFSEELNEIEIIYPKVEEKPVRILTSAEQKVLTKYLLTDSDPCKLGILLSLWTGLRIGEICALRGQNISLCDETISIEATIQRIKKPFVDTDSSSKTFIIIGPPKSKCSIRLIPLTRTTLELCKQIMPLQDEAFVLTGTEHYLEPRALQYRFDRYTNECGLKNVHFHTLRHTFATQCVETGIDIKTLSEILGHSSPSVTINKYIHSSIEMKRRSLDKLNMFTSI